MKTENFIIQNGVYFDKSLLPDTYFEKLYLAVRKKEQRIYRNDELLRLPHIDQCHPHYNEWYVRELSSKRLITYLRRKKNQLKILEVGCGNGWLSHKLAEIPQSEIVALDINMFELRQAANVFTNSNLKFVYGDIRKNIFEKMQFDTIVFAASISYFFSLVEIIRLALQHLTTNGEIHIIDSIFYEEEDIESAKQKCKEYYDKMGMPEMADYFFHHSIKELRGLNYTLMTQKDYVLEKLFSKRNIFPWLCIRQGTHLLAGS